MSEFSTKKCFRMAGMLIAFLGLSLITFGQSRTITGTITAFGGEPVPGVNVLVKGTTMGAATDSNGRFSITVDKPSIVLVVTFVGMKTQEIPVGDKTTLSIALEEDAVGLDAVVAVGYSSRKKSELSSSVITIEAIELTDIATADVGTMLQGKAAGVMVSAASGQPGEGAEIRIRGTGSITAASDPLYVVDGIIGGEFNPNDVESLTILKDAGATGLYGSRAAGGVIVVTTKHGKHNQGPQYQFKASSGLKKVSQGRFELMNSEELYETQRLMFSPALFALQRPESLLQQDYDWLDAAFNTGVLQDYYFSMSNSTDRMRYFISADYYNEDGTLINTDYRRFNTRMNLDFDITKRLNVKTRVAFSTSGSNYHHYTTLEDPYKNTPWDNPYDAEGNPVYIDSDRRPDGSKWYSQDQRNYLQSEAYNFLYGTGSTIMGDFILNYNFTDWLSFTSSNRANMGFDTYASYVDPRTYSTEYDNGYLYNSAGLGQYWLTSNMLKADKEFGKHSINAILGTEYSEGNYNFMSASVVDIAAGLTVLNAGLPFEVGGVITPSATSSVFSQAQYSYSNRYFATLSYRIDGSSNFGPNNRWGSFPSAAVSWLVSNEEFLKNSSLIHFLKARTSYGITGNANIGSFQYLANYSFHPQYANTNGAVPVNMANPDLGWESAAMFNAGFDIGFFNRIDLSVDFYTIENKDLLLNVPVAPSTGFEYQTRNAGAVRNRGLEFQLTTTNFEGEFAWRTAFNIAFNHNEVVEIPAIEDGYMLQTVGSIYQIIEPGEDMFTWYMPVWAGVDPANGDPLWEKIIRDDQGNVISTETTNIYSDATYQKAGQASPDFTGGMRNDLSWKNLMLSFHLNFVYGNEIYNQSRMFFDADGAYLGYNMMKLQDDWSRWEFPGDEATHPKPVMNGNQSSNKTSSRYLEDGSFLRVRNVTLSYNMPKRISEKMNLNTMRLYVSGDNLFTFTGYSGMDPEVSLARGAWSLAGLDSFHYPISRQLMFGIDISF